MIKKLTPELLKYIKVNAKFVKGTNEYIKRQKEIKRNIKK